MLSSDEETQNEKAEKIDLLLERVLKVAALAAIISLTSSKGYQAIAKLRDTTPSQPYLFLLWVEINYLVTVVVMSLFLVAGTMTIVRMLVPRTQFSIPINTWRFIFILPVFTTLFIIAWAALPAPSP